MQTIVLLKDNEDLKFTKYLKQKENDLRNFQKK
jgi:hypothetical protein